MKKNSSKISKFIENLTGISNSFIEQNGLEVEEAFNEFYRFVSKFGSLKYHDFYIYGNGDYSFIKTTAKSLKTIKMMSFAAWLNTYMIDYSKDMFNILFDSLKVVYDDAIIVLANCSADKVSFICSVSPKLTSTYKAGNIIKKVTSICGGSGGGRPDVAQGGGKDISKLDEVLSKVKEQM